jgi:hypothetical protein
MKITIKITVKLWNLPCLELTKLRKAKNDTLGLELSTKKSRLQNFWLTTWIGWIGGMKGGWE